MGRSFGVVVCLLCSSVLCQPCFGQAGKAELFGRIEDPAGFGVAGVKVTAQQQSTSAEFEASSDEHGDYHLLGLTAGQYTLEIEKQGFRQYQQTGIVMRIGDQTRQDIKLE